MHLCGDYRKLNKKKCTRQNANDDDHELDFFAWLTDERR